MFRLERDHLFRQWWFWLLVAFQQFVFFAPYLGNAFAGLQDDSVEGRLISYIVFMIAITVGTLFMIGSAGVLHELFLKLRYGDSGTRNKARKRNLIPLVLAIAPSVSLLAIVILTGALGFLIPATDVILDLATGGNKNPYLSLDAEEVILIAVTFFAPILSLVGVAAQLSFSLKEQRRLARKDHKKRAIAAQDTVILDRIKTTVMLKTEISVVLEQALKIRKVYLRGYKNGRSKDDRRHYIATEPETSLHISMRAYEALIGQLGGLEDIGTIQKTIRLYSLVGQLIAFSGSDVPKSSSPKIGAGRWQDWYAKKVIQCADEVIPALDRQIARDRAWRELRSNLVLES